MSDPASPLLSGHLSHNLQEEDKDNQNKMKQICVNMQLRINCTVRLWKTKLF